MFISWPVLPSTSSNVLTFVAKKNDVKGGKWLRKMFDGIGCHTKDDAHLVDGKDGGG